MKLWIESKLNKDVENFTVGNDYILDQKLVQYDCLGSIAHTKMLGKIGVLKMDEVQRLVKELRHIIELNKKGKFKIRKEQEDCHTAIEDHLVKQLKDIGKKIHTCRSRNDQVLTALRLYYKDKLKNCQNLVQHLIKSFQRLVKRYRAIEVPGYSHTRKAMPSSVAMWGKSFIDSMNDNLKLFKCVLELIDQSPLGTGAGYGVPMHIDRRYTARLLGFQRIQKNPIYAQNSRGKFEATILHTLSQVMFDLNKISTDLITFSIPELGYFELPEEICTGSSLMPQKKNPDVLELLRAKYHLVVSYEIQVKSTLSNLISGYNRDVQLTKEAVIKGLDTAEETLSIMRLVIDKLEINKKRCQQGLSKEIYATEEVHKLVKQGVPFREAYKRVAEKYRGQH